MLSGRPSAPHFSLSTEIFISEIALPIDIVVSEMLSAATRIGNGHRDPSFRGE